MRRTFATVVAPAAADITCSPESTMSDGRNQNAPPGVLVSSAIDFIFKSDGETCQGAVTYTTHR